MHPWTIPVAEMADPVPVRTWSRAARGQTLKSGQRPPLNQHPRVPGGFPGIHNNKLQIDRVRQGGQIESLLNSGTGVQRAQGGVSSCEHSAGFYAIGYSPPLCSGTRERLRPAEPRERTTKALLGLVPVGALGQRACEPGLAELCEVSLILRTSSRNVSHR